MALTVNDLRKKYYESSGRTSEQSGNKTVDDLRKQYYSNRKTEAVSAPTTPSAAEWQRAESREEERSKTSGFEVTKPLTPVQKQTVQNSNRRFQTVAERAENKPASTNVRAKGNSGGDTSSRFGKGLQSIGLNTAASTEYLIDTAKAAAKNQKEYANSIEKQLYAEALSNFNMVRSQYAEGTPEYQEAWAQLQKAQADLDKVGTATVDPNSRSSQFMAGVQQLQEDALEGTSGVGRFLGETALSIGSNVAKLPMNAILPGSSLALMGAEAAANKAYELQQQGVSAGEALGRGLVSGGIEALTEKVPLDNLVDIIKTGGKVGLMNILKQAVTEAGEEGVAYLLNLGADKVAGDPAAEFVWNDFWKSVGMGALSGGIMGGGATAINRANAAAVGKNYQDVATELVAEGLQMKQDTDAYRTAAEMQRKLDAGKTMSNVDVGRVVQDNETTMAPLRQAAMEMAEAEVKQRAAERTATVSKSLGYGKEGARVFGEIYNGGEVDAKTLLAVFDTPYQAGLTGGDGKQYTDPMQIAAYSAGNSDRIAQQGIDAKAKPGKVFSKAESGFDYTNAPADLTQQQKNFGNLMAKTFGIKGNFVKGETAYNARYVSNVGEVNFAKDFGIDPQMMQKLGDIDFQQKVEQLANKRQQSFAFYVAHEIADHVAANRAPVEMRAFNNAMYNYLLETEGANLARERMAFYGSRGANLDTKGAIEEVAADSILMLYDGDEQKFMTAMERVLNGTDEQAKRGAKTWGEALKNIIEKLKAWARKLTGRDNAQAKADVEKSITELERLREMFETAVAKAAQNTEQARQIGATKNTTPEGGVRMSAKRANPGYNAFRDVYAKKGLDALSEKLGDLFPLSANFESAISKDTTKLSNVLVKANSAVKQPKENFFAAARRTVKAHYPKGSEIPISQIDVKAKIGLDFAEESIAKAKNNTERQTILDIIPHVKDLLPGSRLLAVEKVQHTDNKKTSLFCYRLYNAYKRTETDVSGNTVVRQHAVVFTVVQNLEDAGAYLVTDIKSIAPDRARIADNSKSLHTQGDASIDTVAELYEIVKGIPRNDGGLAYTDTQKLAYLFSYTERADGTKYSLKDQDYTNAVNAGDTETAQRMVDEVAKTAGYNVKLHHGTAGEPFYVFRQGAEGIHFGTIAQATKRAEVAGSRYGYNRSKHTSADIRKNPSAYRNSARKAILDHIVHVLPVKFTGAEQDAAAELIYDDDKVITDKVLMEYLDRAEDAVGVALFSLTNYELGKTSSGRVVSAYVKANRPMVFDVDIGEWTSSNLASVLIDKINGNKTEMYSYEKDGWEEYDPANITGINLTAADIPALEKLQHSRYFDDMAEFLQEKGIDSIRYLNTYEGTRDEESYILLSPNQVKSADPVTYDDAGNVIPLSKRFNTESDDIRYSMKDSKGNTLSKEQQEFFKDSKVRDRNGNLKVMYRGGNEDFTVFDRKKSSYSNLYGRGFYFTDSESHAKQYGKAKAFYLDIKNPVSTTERTITEEQMRKYLEAVAENEDDYSFENYGYGATVDSVLDGVFSGKSDFAMLYDVSQTAIGDMVEAVELFNEVNGTDYDGLILDTETVTFRSNQIKSVANEKPTADKDIRFSLKGEQQMAKELKRIREEGKKAGKSAEQIRTEVAQIVGPEYAELLKTYGAIERGETPFRDIQVPERTGKNRKVSQTVRTILEAEATPDAMIPDVEALVAEGALSFESYTDDQAIADATAKLQTKGWSNTLSKWISDVDKGVVTKENTVTGWALYNNAANKGDVETALTILQKMVGHQRNAAQALQATRVLKKLSPDAQLYGVQRSVQDLQDELNKKYGDDKAPQLKIDPELGEKFMQAKTDAERDEVMGEIYRDIGKQMPSTFRDKWNAWRYLAMLGNARTHVRNIVGNAGFAPVVGIKNITATGIEALVSGVSGGKIGRTKAITADKAMLKAAWEDYGNVADEISNGGKYSDFQNANKQIEAGRVIFKNKALEKARTFNSAAMEKEDTWFSKPHYAAALASYCKANGITAQQIAKGGKAMDKARAYAIKEAQKATYRDTNALSQAFGEIGGKWRTSGNPVKKGVGIAIEGILPFRKTPANILARGVEYSPIGLMNGIKKAVWDVQKGNATAAEAIDNISAGLTGSMLMALGAFLAAQGLIRGGGEGDDKEKEFAELQGHQTYAMELPNGKSVTLDWLAPEALPFFIGVNFFESTQGKKEEMDIDSIIGSVTSITEPLLEMSCLQGLNDLIDSVGYASGRDVNSLVAMAASAATSYLTQALPTLGGQIERTFERERMTTYSDKNKRWIPADLQYTIGKATAKIPIPGLDYQQIPYIDAWGRTESTGNFAENAFGNLLNPSYTSQIDTTAMEDELLRLYRSTGESVFPSRAARYFMVNNERKDLTAEEYVQYATLKGRYSYELLTDLVDSNTYKSLTDAEKAKMVKEVFDNANKQAKSAISEYKLDEWAAKYAEAEKKYGIKQEVFAEVRMNTRFLESLKDKKSGETITNSLSLLKMEAVYNIPGLTDKQRQALFDYLDVGKSVRHYNKSLVKQKLASMRRDAK